MPNLQGSKTEKNLQEAFAGESQANRKYLAFAKKADAEGHPQVAKLFRAAAEAETVHAHAHLRALGGETHEFIEMYPQMIQEATREGFADALRSFTLANAVEKVHADLYSKALESFGKNAAVDYSVCQICGNTIEGGPEGPCEICGAAKAAFRKID